MPGSSMEPARPAPKTEVGIPPTERTGDAGRETKGKTPFERAHEAGMRFGQAVIEYVERTRRETAEGNTREKAEADGLNREAQAAAARAQSEMAAVQSRLEQAGQPETSAQPRAEVLPDPAFEAKRSAMEGARGSVAKLEAKLKQFEGFGALKRLGDKGRAEHKQIMDELSAARLEYASARAEYVGTSAMRMLEERSALADKVAQERNQEKGLGEKVYDAYKKLGDMSLAKIWKPKSKALQFFAKAANVRTLISAGLLGMGLAAGAAGGVGVGVGVLVARRMFAGMSASFGSYDLMRVVADRRAGKVDENKLEGMAIEEIVARMEKLEAENMRNGTEVSKSEGYQKLTAEYARRAQVADEGLVEMAAVQPLSPEQIAHQESLMAQFMAEADRGLEAARSKNAKKNRAMKVAAGAVGVIVGTGLLAKAVGAVAHEISGTKPMVAEAQIGKSGVKLGVAQEVASQESADAAAARALAAERLAAGTFEKGDTLKSVTQRLLMASPKEYGYTGNLEDKAALAKWANAQSSRMLQDQGFVRQVAQGSARITRVTEVVGSDQNHPAHAALVRDANGALRIQLDQNAKLVDAMHGEKPFAASGLVSAEQIAAEAKNEIGKAQYGLDRANEALRGMDPQKMESLRKIINHERYLDSHPVAAQGTVRYSPELIKKWSGMVREFDNAQNNQTIYSERLAAAQDKLRYANSEIAHIRGQVADWDAVRSKGGGGPRVSRFDSDELARVANAPRTAVDVPKPAEASVSEVVKKTSPIVAQEGGASLLDTSAAATGALAGAGMIGAHVPKRQERGTIVQPAAESVPVEANQVAMEQGAEAFPENPNPFSLREPGALEASAATEDEGRRSARAESRPWYEAEGETEQERQDRLADEAARAYSPPVESNEFPATEDGTEPETARLPERFPDTERDEEPPTEKFEAVTKPNSKRTLRGVPPPPDAPIPSREPKSKRTLAGIGTPKAVASVRKTLRGLPFTTPESKKTLRGIQAMPAEMVAATMREISNDNQTEVSLEEANRNLSTAMRTLNFMARENSRIGPTKAMDAWGNVFVRLAMSEPLSKEMDGRLSSNVRALFSRSPVAKSAVDQSFVAKLLNERGVSGPENIARAVGWLNRVKGGKMEGADDAPPTKRSVA